MAWSSLTAIFRRLFSRRSTSSTSDPALPVEIGAGEDFVRFILSRSQFAAGPGRVKPQALMPMFNTSKGRFETSTHRIAGLTDAQVWELGYSYVENRAEKRVVKASGIGKFELVTGQGLALDVKGALIVHLIFKCLKTLMFGFRKLADTDGLCAPTQR